MTSKYPPPMYTEENLQRLYNSIQQYPNEPGVDLREIFDDCIAVIEHLRYFRDLALADHPDLR